MSSSARGDSDMVALGRFIGRPCGWCGASLMGRPVNATTCGRKCRQSMFRARKWASLSPGGDDRPRRFAYVDPPYPGFSGLYKEHPDYGGEVDHRRLLQDLVDAEYDGWALSTSASTMWYVQLCLLEAHGIEVHGGDGRLLSFEELCNLMPAGYRWAAWMKPIGVSSKTYGMHNTWEPVLVFGGRQLRPGVRDWVESPAVRAQTAKLGGSDLIGRKPDLFNQAVFRWLGMRPEDTMDDLFPGTGAVMQSWKAVGGCPGDRRWPASFVASDDDSSPTDLHDQKTSSTAAVTDRPSPSTSPTTNRRPYTDDESSLQERQEAMP